jgi:hypothetical protein
MSAQPNRPYASEIFYGPTQEELWRSVASIGSYHLRALYQSLS